MAKILLVEDDNNLREIYEARLQAEGYNTVSAHDGEEALVVAKAEHPDLIISDVMMPKISGFEMLDIIRNTDELKDVKIIMLTALGQSDDQQRADRLGADRYLVKSQVTLEDIVRVAQDILAGSSGAAASEPLPAPPAQTAVAPTTAIPPIPQPPQPAATAPVQTATPPAPAVMPQPSPMPAVQVAAPQPTTPVAPGVPIAPQPIAQPVAPAPQVTLPPSAPVVPEVPEPVNTTGVTPMPESQIVLDQALLETPEPTAATTTDPAVSSSPANNDAQSTIDEANNIEAQIEDYVQHNILDAPAAEPDTPVAESASETSIPASAPAAVDPLPQPEETAATNDQNLLVSAVDTLASATSTTDTSDDTATVSSSSATFVDTGQPKKKVIAPIDTDPKPDLNELLAAEEAKVNSPALTPQPQPISQPVATAAPVPTAQLTPSPQPAAPAVEPIPVASAPTNVDVDPNSIAL